MDDDRDDFAPQRRVYRFGVRENRGHGGMAFVEETARQLTRYPNVYVNLEVTASLTVAKPTLFVHAGLAGLIGPSREAGIDRLIWGTGASV